MATSIKRTALAKSVSRPDRRRAGRTWAARTPLAVRTSGVHLDRAFRERIRQRLGWRMGKFAPHLERVAVRFEDVNGPRGGSDIACKVKVVISGRPSVLVEETAGAAAEAFERVDHRVETAVRRSIGRARERRLLRRQLPRRGEASRARASQPAAPPSRGTAARNEKRRTRKATVALEDSARSRPSRKSTRRSANRAKHGNKLARREQRRLSSPQARRTRASHKR